MSERTVRKWSDEFYASQGEIPEEGCGTGEQNNTVRDEGIHRKVVAWIRAKCGKRNTSLNIQKLALWVNGELLPSLTLPEGWPTKICRFTAWHWMKELGFHYSRWKKDM